MNIEQRFLQKVKPLSIVNDILKCDFGEFDIKDVKKIVVLKERF